MRPIRQAFIAVFLMFAAFDGSATAAHCRSGDRLILGEWSDQVAPGTFDPQRPSWELEPVPGTIAWGITCQDGDSTGSGQHLSGISILSGQSIAQFRAPGCDRHWFLPDRLTYRALRSAPDPKPPKSMPAGI